MLRTETRELTLTEVQREVIEAPPGRQVFLARAGAGKTLVLGERAVRLVERGIARADQLLLLAPSRRVALALGNHVRSRLGNTVAPVAASFHGLALAIQRRHYRELGYRRLPQVLTTARHFHTLRLALAAESPDQWPHLGRAIGSDALWKLARDLAIGAAENGLDPTDLRRRVLVWGQPELEDLIEFVIRFQARLRGEGAVDFGQLLADVVRLLAARPEIAKYERRTYRHILVDELEDANAAQVDLLCHLLDEESDLVVAGDPEQAINSFRSGSPTYLLGCAGQLGARLVTSAENHRSAERPAELVRSVRPNSITMSLEGDAVTRPDGIPTQAGDPGGDTGFAVLRPSTYPSDEARWIADQVASLIRAGTRPARIAILVRALAAPVARLIAAELARRDIPHRVQSGKRVLADPLLQATADLLRYLLASRQETAGHADRSMATTDGADGSIGLLESVRRATADLAFLRVLDSPLSGLPPFGLTAVRRAAALAERDVAHLEADGLDDLVLDEDVRSALTALLDRLADLRSKLAWGAPSLLWEIWRLFPAFRDDALAGGQASAAYAALLNEVAGIGRRRFIGLADAVDLLDTGYFDHVASSSPESHGVLMTTVHQAKGQEWEVVFLPGLTEGAFPLCHSPLDLDPLLARDLPEAPDGPLSAAAAELIARRHARHAAEERRVFHVAVSRACRGLYLSCSRRGADGASAELPSRFLDAVTGCPAVDVIIGDAVEPLPLEVDAAVLHYRRLLRSAEPLLQAQGLYALHEMRRRWPEAVRPAEWWGNIGETVGAAPPFPDGSLHLSATRLGAYRDCPLAYQFGYHWRLTEPEGPALTVGNLIHQVLEEYHRPDSPLPRTRQALGETLNRRFDETAFLYRPLARQARKALDEMLDVYFARYGQSGPTVAVERPFQFAFGSHMISGLIDRVDRLPEGGLELIDYKTGSAMSKDEAKLDLQLALYDLAFFEDEELRGLGQPTRVSYLYLKSIGPRADGKRGHAPAGDSRDWLKTRVRYYADAILAERFPAHRSIPRELPDLDPMELDRALRNDPCRFCGFTWVCPEAEREAGNE
ncbi:MAG: ATP-dependent helicase [Chloroflexi bacterium]|nr:ATP-dependent helicase [Chloroflexota bacterium]